MIFGALLVATLPAHAWTYKILLLPMTTKSHVFSMAAIAEGLISRGHSVWFFVGENYPLTLQPELSDQPEFRVVRYKYRPTMDGAHVDYNAMEEYINKLAIESGGHMTNLQASIISKMYVFWDQELIS